MNVCIVAATNRNLQEAIKTGRFRQDLFFRLDVLTVEMPRLSERREDIPLLAAHFMKIVAKSVRLRFRLYQLIEKTCLVPVLAFGATRALNRTGRAANETR